MMNKTEQKKHEKLIFMILFSAMVAFLIPGCGNGESRELYHRFRDKSWARFNILSFEIPVNKARNYNLYLFARFTPEFQYGTLDFNMVLNTPAGEERIHEYQMEVKSKSGDFSIECNKDSCQGTILLKREINIAKPGILKIEIENLTPRLSTDGVLGVGIRMVPSGK
jgi:gliding motility-associated lipoprotein GldH